MGQDGIRDRVNAAIDRARDAAEGVAGDARVHVNDGLRRAADRAEDAYGASLRTVESRAREQPLPALALALGIGFVIGLLAIRS